MIDGSKTGTAQERYNVLAMKREPYLRRARANALLTIPALFPPDGHNDHSTLVDPFQSVGARGLNNMANKLTIALMPHGRSFIKMELETKAIREMNADAQLKAAVEKALGSYEQLFTRDVDSSGDRTKVYEKFRHLLASGNDVMHVRKDGIRLYHLAEYVCRRDPVGTVRELILREEVTLDALPEETQAKVLGQMSNKPDAVLEMFTYCWRNGNLMHVHQEVKGVRVDGSTGTYPLDKFPYMVLRYSAVDGEAYGRSFVEEYYGDLRSLESLTKALVEGAVAAAKLLLLVKPGGTTSITTITGSPNMAVREGNADDITILRMDKQSDFQVAERYAAVIEGRLAAGFLLQSDIVRDAERVTAEEVRLVAAELEDALGGFYSLMSQEFQLPYAKIKIANNKDLPKLPNGVAKPMITAGMAALGRGAELRSIDVLIESAIATFGQAHVASELDLAAYLQTRAVALGVDISTFTKSPEQKAQEQQDAALASTAQQIAPEMAKQGLNAALTQPPQEG